MEIVDTLLNDVFNDLKCIIESEVGKSKFNFREK